MRCAIFLLLFFSVSPLHATTWGSDCSYDTQIYNVTLPSGKRISIDPNVAVGTVFFEHYVGGQSGQNFKCQTAHNYTLQGAYTYGAGGRTIEMSGGGLSSPTGTYPVYKTNVEGLGLVVRRGSSAFPYWFSSYSYTNKILNYTGSITQVFDIDLVKYGDIPIGSHTVTIDSTVIPSIDSIVQVSNSSNPTALPNGLVTMSKFILSPATFYIVSATCDTPDVTVHLGSHHIADTRNREDSHFATPWVDASIRLINCPVFYGTGERGDNKDIIRNNVMTVSLLAGNATTSSQGIMPVDTGPSAAQGVSIQLAYGTAASPQFVDFSAGKGTQTYTMSPTQGATYTIPLVARYIQTASSIADISPGQGNGKMTYMITYY